MPNAFSDDVSIIDVPSQTTIGPVTIGDVPDTAAVRGDQSLVYVSNAGSNSISVIDTANNTVVATINVGTAPSGVVVSPDGRRVFVANTGDNTVSVIDTANNTIVATVNVGTAPSGVAVSPDGRRVFVVNGDDDTVSVIDATDNSIIATVAVGDSPGRLAVSPDGGRVYVTNLLSQNVTVIDTATNTAIATITIAGDPVGVAISPDGSRAYVTDGDSIVSVIDTATNTVIQTIFVGNNPTGVAISPDGSRLYVTRFDDDTVAVIDTATNTMIATLTVGDFPAFAGACGNGNALLTAGNTFVVKQSGALACTGAGGPVFTGGTMKIAAANITSALPMTLGAQGGTIDTQGNTATFSGAITGTGGLTKVGTGTLVLSGANTYTGATNVNQGTLQAGAANTFSPASAFTVATGATLDLNGFNQTIGSLAGAGAVLLGNATLTAGGDNTSTTFSGVIGGTGGLTKTGSGVLTLSGNNTYTGTTVVNGGGLLVNGSLASSLLTVNGNAFVGGTGTLPNTLINGGTLAPGNSIGTVTVNGNLTFTPGSTYAVEVSPLDADRTNVTGTATLAGTVQATFQPGSYVTRNYTILSAAGGLGGTTFGALTTSNLPAGFTAELNYTATDVLLSLTGALGAGTTLARNPNNVATAINTAFNSGTPLPAAFLPLFDLSGPALSDALNQLSGEVATGFLGASHLSMSLFLNAMIDPFVMGRNGAFGAAPLAYATQEPSRVRRAAEDAMAAALPVKAPSASAPDRFARRWSVWGSAYGGKNRLDGDGTVVGSHDLWASTGGFAAGVDYRVSPWLTLGAAVAIGETSWSVAGLGSGDSNLAQVGGYAAARWGAFYLSGAAAGAWHNVDTRRTVAITGDALRAAFDATAVGGRVEGGWRHQVGTFGVTPYAAVQVQSVHTPTYSEQGTGAFALTYASQTATDTRTELGLWADTRHRLADGAEVLLRGRAAWVHDVDPDRRINAVFQTLPGASFTVEGAAAARDAALLSAVGEVRLANGVSFIAKADGEFSSHGSVYAATGTVRYTW